MTDVYSRLERIINQCAQISTDMWKRGWLESNAGNISIDVTDTIAHLSTSVRTVQYAIKTHQSAGRFYLVSAAGARLQDIARSPENCLLVIRIAESLDSYDVIWGGKGKHTCATSELAAHLHVHDTLLENKRKEQAIVHAHPLYLLALTQIKEYCDKARLNDLLWSMHPEMKMIIPEGVGFIPYHQPGTEALALATQRAIETGHSVVIWEKHGCLAVGKDCIQAFDLIDIVEKSIQIFLICKSAGYEAQGLSSADIKKLGTRTDDKTTK
jgi:rhamnulose-1-phosphate aldolase